MPKETTFFVVWNPEHGLPRVRHEERYLAVDEAKRMAASHPGQKFYVLSAVAVAERAEPVTVTELDEIPF